MDAFWTAKLIQISFGAIGGVIGLGIGLAIAKLFKLDSKKHSALTVFPIIFAVLAIQLQPEIYNPGKREIAALLEEATILQNTQEKEMQPWAEKFAALHLDFVISAKTLTSKKNIEDARRTIDDFERLITQRKALLIKHWDEHEKRINRISNASIRGDALTTFNSNKSRLSVAYNTLDSVQFEFSKTISEVLSFSESILGQTLLKDDQIIFKTQAQLDRYTNYMEKLALLAKRESAATKAINDLMIVINQEQQKSLNAIK